MRVKWVFALPKLPGDYARFHLINWPLWAVAFCGLRAVASAQGSSWERLVPVTAGSLLAF